MSIAFESLNGLEHAADALLQGMHKRAYLGENDVSSTPGCRGGASHSNAHVGLLQGRCIIHAIPCMTALESRVGLQGLHTSAVRML